KVHDFPAHELRALFAAAHAKTANLVAAFDACSSGNAVRGLEPAADVVERWVPPEKGARASASRGADDRAGAGSEWTPFLSGLTALSAAIDGTSALEPADGGLGYFSSALVDALSEAYPSPPTWAQIARRAERQIAALSKNRQLPRFQG